MSEQRNYKVGYVAFIAFIAAISGILFGYDTGVISGAMIYLKMTFQFTPAAEGWIVTVLLLGAAIGALGIGRFSDKMGRKKLLILTAILFIIGSLGLTYANSLNEIIAYRFLLGLAVGIASFAAPSYIAEVSPKELRGTLVSFFQLAITIGILLTYYANYHLAGNVDSWRSMFFCGIIPAIILLVGLFFLPESPRWLIVKGRDTEAISILRKLRGEHFETELQEIKQIAENDKKKESNWGELFKKANHPVIWIALFIMLFQQLSGINAIIYYAPEVFMKAGLGESASLLSTVLVGVVNVVSTIIGLSLLDKVGRKPIVIFGSVVMAISLATVAYLFNVGINPSNSYIAIGAVLGYIFGFAISLGLVAWLVISEIFPLNIRGEGSSLGAAFNWIFNMCVSFSFPIFLHSFGTAMSFAFFALICILCIFYTIFFLPETKEVSLEIIEKNLIKGVKSKDLGHKALN